MITHKSVNGATLFEYNKKSLSPDIILVAQPNAICLTLILRFYRKDQKPEEERHQEQHSIPSH